MANLPTNFEEFADARKGAFMNAKGFKENGGNLVGVLCSYAPVELIEAAGRSPSACAARATRPCPTPRKSSPRTSAR